jgi:hypothetical protein
MAVIINASTSTGLVQSADTSGIIQFQSNGSTKATLNSSGFSYPGGVLQVVSVTKVDTFSTTSSSFVDVTGLSVSITPRSASNKILITGLISYGASGEVGMYRLVRDSTAICVGTAAGNRVAATGQHRNANDSGDADSGNVNFLDSPNTTSSVTYKIQAIGLAGTVRFNSSADDIDQINRGRTASTITVMEIAV